MGDHQHADYWPDLADALKAEVVARRQDDGSWLCECGESTPTDVAMFRHRQAAHNGGDSAVECICPRFTDTGGFRIADLGCPVHGVNGTEPGDGYWTDDNGS